MHNALEQLKVIPVFFLESVPYSDGSCLQSQRDLMVGTRDWFVRHDRQSIDQVDKLKKRVEQNSTKLETTRSGQKDGWQAEADKFAGLIERDLLMAERSTEDQQACGTRCGWCSTTERTRC
jgi:hypothetical protein